MRRPSAAYILEVCWGIDPVPTNRAMLGQRSAAQTRDHDPQVNPTPTITASTAAPSIPRRESTVSHDSCGLRIAKRLIVLQPSEAVRRLPARGLALTIRAHVGGFCGA